MLVGVVIRRRAPYLGGGLCLLGFVLLYAFSTALVSSLLMRVLDSGQVVPVIAAHAGAGRSDTAIVILSGDMRDAAPEYGGDTVGPLTLERLRYGAFLARRSNLPVLVTGGIIDPKGPPIAEIMRQILETEFHIPVRWVEAASRNTRENALFSARILKPAGIDRILLVTDAWHMPRALIAFRGLGLTLIPAPTGFYISRPGWLESLAPTAQGLQRSAYALHEMIGNLWYRLAYR